MSASQINGVVQHLRATVLLRDGAGLTDGQLLADYINQSDDAALAALVRRHGPMVWGVCRRVLGNYHDAEDAFQATFLVLVRKATSIVPRQKVANWLYGVARQTALKARAAAARRKGRERQVTEMSDRAPAEPDRRPDLQALLDEELSRLPGKHRAVLVLCDLEGKTRKEAALQLGVPEGSVAGWLARARTLLAKRLTRRGVAVLGGAVAAILAPRLASARVPASVVSKTMKFASLLAAGHAIAEVIPGKVAALMEGVLKTMFLSKLKVVVGTLLLMAVLIAGGVAVVLGQAPDSPPTKDEGAGSKRPNVKEEAARAMLKRLEGTWGFVSVHANGARNPTPAVFLLIKDSSWECLTREGKVTEKWTIRLVDLEASPKRIDIIEGKDVPGRKDRTLNGIFMHDGDSLVLCFGALDRPTVFFTQAGDGCMAFQFKRVGAK
jgi:RNA polymerase sigma factor (sigma-70 family)